jgi:hypothetical protein
MGNSGAQVIGRVTTGLAGNFKYWLRSVEREGVYPGVLLLRVAKYRTYLFKSDKE